uniref:Uncharacterized protein n=1 Tax=Anopheles culicifacies TaxID=139723 RepID=A0A182MMR7_9DIPT
MVRDHDRRQVGWAPTGLGPRNDVVSILESIQQMLLLSGAVPRKSSRNRPGAERDGSNQPRHTFELLKKSRTGYRVPPHVINGFYFEPWVCQTLHQFYYCTDV